MWIHRLYFHGHIPSTKSFWNTGSHEKIGSTICGKESWCTWSNRRRSILCNCILLLQSPRDSSPIYVPIQRPPNPTRTRWEQTPPQLATSWLTKNSEEPIEKNGKLENAKKMEEGRNDHHEESAQVMEREWVVCACPSSLSVAAEDFSIRITLNALSYECLTHNVPCECRSSICKQWNCPNCGHHLG